MLAQAKRELQIAEAPKRTDFEFLICSGDDKALLRREQFMPAWSPVVADVFVRLARADGRAFDQIQLQKLVYIAHGYCLAVTGQPLTGDRPEAMEFGPTYKRLSDRLVRFGHDPVTSFSNDERQETRAEETSGLDQTEMDLLAWVYQDYHDFPAARLSVLTRQEGTPWDKIYANGAGRCRDIPHSMIRTQFEAIVIRKEGATPV